MNGWTDTWPWLDRLALRTAGLTGRRRYGLALLLGLGLALAMPPFHLLPLIAVGFTGLIWQIEGCTTRRQAFAIGWCFGFGFFVAGLYWIANALLVDSARFWWMVPLAAAGLPALLALFVALATLALHWLRLRGTALALGFAVAWSVAEYLRGHILTGFPWNLVGYGWAPLTAMLQIGSIVGIYGLGLATALAAALPATRRPGIMLAGLALLLAIGGYGAVRLAGAPAIDDPKAQVPGVTLRLVQPNIPQQEKWNGEKREQHLLTHLEMSAAPVLPGLPAPTHIVWSETAVPFLLSEDVRARALIGSVAPSGGAVLTGGIRVDRSGGQPDFWNSLYAIGPGGTVPATYDKAHLVPFGEYMPLRGILGFVPTVASSIDFQAGPGPRTIDVPGIPSPSPLICYEVIFPGAVSDPADRPGWLLNVTNDGWYGFSTGPFQHFQIARMRAVEEGLPLVRVANTGISGIVDSYGRVTRRIGLEEKGVVDGPLPRALAAPTLYARWGDALYAGALLLLLLCTIVIGRRGT